MNRVKVLRLGAAEVIVEYEDGRVGAVAFDAQGVPRNETNTDQTGEARRLAAAYIATLRSTGGEVRDG